MHLLSPHDTSSNFTPNVTAILASEILFPLNMIRTAFAFTICISLLAPVSHAQAQETTPTTGPIYIIQPGDSLLSIATRFGISLDELLFANNIADPNNISAGAQVTIPGLQGVSGILDTELIGYGDTLRGLSRRNQVDEYFLQKLNRITSPAELFAGTSLILPQKDTFTPLTHRVALEKNLSLFEAAIINNSDPWMISQANGLGGTWGGVPGDALYDPTSNSEVVGQSGLPPAFLDVKVDPLPMFQGGTSVIYLRTMPGVNLSGSLVDKPLQFFPMEDGGFIALQGIHAMLEPGAYPLRLDATLPDGSKQSFEQMVIILSGNYPNDPLLLVEPSTIDPTVTEPEFAQLTNFTSTVTQTRYWSGIFQSPSYYNDCFTSRYGNRRIYIGTGTEEQIYSFHSGLDFCGGVGLPISAPADGVVIFAGPLTVRGNATIIDHGWGVYSGMWHQSEINVQVGQIVKKGDLIGLVGGTGRVTGAHLHWELWVNGVQVDPMVWLNTAYP